MTTAVHLDPDRLWRHGPGKSAAVAPVRPGPESDSSGGLGLRPALELDIAPMDAVSAALAELPYPARAAAGSVGDPAAVIGAALRVHRLEPHGEYAFHSSHPSVRAKYPVVVRDRRRGLVFDPWSWRWCADPVGADRHGPRFRLQVRTEHLPRFYGGLRPILGDLEQGVTLRHLATVAGAVGLELVATGDAQDGVAFDLVPGSAAPAGGAGEPAFDAPTWGRILERRSAGRMPRGLPGALLSASRGLRRDESAALTAALGGTVPLPGPAVVGIHTAHRRGDRWHRDDGAPVPADAMAEVLASHGLPNAPRNGAYLERAEFLAFATADPDAIAAEHGAEAVRLALVRAGWLMQGLSYPAAACGRVCRPTRSFDDPAVTSLLGRPRREHVLLAAVIGVSPATGIEVLL